LWQKKCQFYKYCINILCQSSANIFYNLLHFIFLCLVYQYNFLSYQLSVKIYLLLTTDFLNYYGGSACCSVHSSAPLGLWSMFSPFCTTTFNICHLKYLKIKYVEDKTPCKTFLNNILIYLYREFRASN